MSTFDGNGNGNGNGHRNGTGERGNGNRPVDGGSPDGRTRKEREQDEIPEAGQRTAVNSGTRFGVGMPVEKSENFMAVVSRLLRRMREERLRVLFVVVLALISVTLTVIGPRILGDATNVVVDGVVSGKGIDFSQLHSVLLDAALIYLCAGLLAYTQSFILAGVVQRSMHRLRSDVEDKLNALPLSYIDRQPRGDLLSRVTNDIDNVAQSLQQTLSMMLTSALTIVGVVIMMISISPVLALITLITVPVSLVAMKLITARSKKQFIAQWRYTGTLNAQIEEAFTGHNLVRVFGMHDEVQARFDDENELLFESSFWAQFISGCVQPAMMFLGNLNFLAIAVIGGLRVSSGALSVGDIQAFIQYSRQFTQPLTQLAAMANVLQSGIASLERVFELLDVEEQRPEAVDPLTNPSPKGRIEFEHVTFSYTPVKPLITDLGLVAQPGATVAIVGPTGAGKTTLVNLVMRFYELDGGRITLDGNDISQMRRHELRSSVGMVLQDTWLFEGTIRENIAFGNPGATEEEIVAAAKATHVDHFVRSLPDGYDTVVDDEGTSVSAGEKQLLTIARAFLADPAILILDEATSSVDTRTEVLIQKAMAALRTNRTSFVIAHRLSTIRDADTILVMENGAIVEQGNHRELLERDGAYARLYNSQFAGAAIEVD
jgi:ATP-binding cassette subfamily B protein